MKRIPTFLAILAIAAFGLFVAGCGGDDDDSSGGSETEEASSEFATAADEICADANAELVAEAEEQYPEAAPEGKDLERFVSDVFVPSLEEQEAAISELTPPEGQEQQVEQLLAALNEGIETIKEDPTTAVDGSAFAEANSIAQELGLTECGSG